ncbi:MAG: hypothetical protein V3R99_01975, partial [Thermoguttaceae bacterium]
ANLDVDVNADGPFAPDHVGTVDAGDNPVPGPGDFGFDVIAIGVQMALHEIVADISSDAAIALGAGGDFTPDNNEWDWVLSSGFADIIDPGVEGSFVSNDIAGSTMADAGSAAANLTENAGVFTLTLPFTRTVNLSASVGFGTTIIVTGTVVAQFTPGAPLVGTQVAADSTAAELNGTGVFMTVTKDATPVTAAGHVAELPENEAWIDEWDAHWVELWVRTSDSDGVTAASVDLAYNTDYFTATQIDYGNVYINDVAGTIDDEAGLVAGIGGSTWNANAGVDAYALLGRVKFESLAGDRVEVDAVGQMIGPYDLGLAITDARAEVAGEPVDVAVADAPQTELWAVVYDVDDNDRIDLGDLSYFASAFSENVLDSDAAYVWALDFDNSGSVDLADLTYFASNFQHSKASGTDVVFPASFTQRWVGSQIELSGDTSLDEVLEAAVATWQEALSASDPIDIQLVVRDFGNDQLGESQILQLGEDGIPTQGRVILDDDAGGLGWHSEIDADVADGKYDLYTVMLHEVGHALGFTFAYGGFAAADFAAQLDDAGQHLLADGYPDDLMNDTLDPAVRKLPSALDVQMLQAAYAAAQDGAIGMTTMPAALHAAPAHAGVSSALGGPQTAPSVTVLGVGFDGRAASLPESVHAGLGRNGLSIVLPPADDAMLSPARQTAAIDWTYAHELDDVRLDLDLASIARRHETKLLDDMFTDWEELLP